MQPVNVRSLFEALEQVADPRRRQGQRHSITTMPAAIICATLCRVRGLKTIAYWMRIQVGQTKEKIDLTPLSSIQ